MSFQPPTLDPGPVATIVFLVLLAHHVITPVLSRGRYARLSQRAEEGDHAIWAGEFRRGGWFVLAETLAVMAFVGTASVVTSADLGWKSPALADLPPVVVAVAGTGLLVGFVVLLVQVFGPQRRVLLHVRAGELPQGMEPADLGRTPQDRREFSFMVGACGLALLSDLLVVYVVLFPMLASALGSPVLAALLLGLLGGWQYLGQGGGPILVTALVSTLALFVYTLFVPGSLVGPLLILGSYWATMLGVTHGFVGLSIPKTPGPARPLHPVEVTLLDSEGRPLDRD